MSVFYFENKHYPNWIKLQSFGREFSFGHPRGVAYEHLNYFFAMGLNRGGEIMAARNDGSTLIEWIAKTFGDTSPIESNNEPGIRYKRMVRPSTLWLGNPDATMNDKINESFVILRILLKKLEELFETIEPTSSNSKAYGHKIRDVLLLGSMEVESSWRAVLKENAYPRSNANLTTNDYVKLSLPMLLDGYELHLSSYSSYPPFTPFAGWDPKNPTKSLVWYDAYNKTKHDREANLQYATLDNAIHAVGAAVVMFYTQFGLRFGMTGFDQKSPVIQNSFRLITTGLERHEREFYIPLCSIKNNQVAVDDWKVVDFSF